ncbi:hypothetical protein FVEN_g4793 [Fusarium venenatum]|uniref:ribonuclease Z n=2 Tax=Fusarium venenatum TaxID=56646 RepID=A0A2L2SYR4_9HYPO|nr:uncharacterized protein FVRRES_11344 [Fusarium venenatum]KAG8357382.1 hypothetical protein FVEN_g4793 [Fusarium venenatum]CEI38653.1 unnamed protein product [Fusarium venenatum]
MSTSIEIVSVPTVDTPGTCLLVHTDQRTYVFGRLEEGTQRAFQSRKVRIGSTEHVFLSGTVSWQQVGGLFGYVLTVGGVLDASREQEAAENLKRKEKGLKALRESSRHPIHIHGGENLNHTLAACRSVILRQPVTVKTHEHREDPRLDTIESLEPDWKDDSLRVWKIPIQRERSSSPQKRRRSSVEADIDSSGPPFKGYPSLSDPEYAGTLVEKLMFNGELARVGYMGTIVHVKLATVKPEDTVFVFQGQHKGSLGVYKGPRPGDPNFEDKGEIVWVFGRSSKSSPDGSLNVLHRPMPPTIYSQTSMCYLVKCLPRRGKFDAQRAKELQVPVGDYRKLIAGETIKTEAGVTVTPEMVVGPEVPGPGFIVADIESHDLIDSFIERPEWSNPELMTDVVAMYWILGPGLITDARIKKFVDQRRKVKHVFCAKDICPNVISLAGPAQLQTKLHIIDPDRFNLLNFDNNSKAELPIGHVEYGRTGNKITLMPRLRFNDGTVTPVVNLLDAAMEVNQEILKLAEQAQKETSDPEFLRKLEEDEKDIPNRDTEIIPLGTGSSQPGKYRNVSSTLIRVPGIGNYLLDVGEGTLGQIRRLFGEEETGNILRDLKCIVISHLHADHHLGTPNLLKAWYEHTINDSNARLAISCVGKYIALLEEVAQVEDFGFHRLHFPRHRDEDNGGDSAGGRCELKEDTFGLKAITRVKVPHCWLAMGTELELTSGLRIAYSGDCRPSMDFARACKGAHLLVHECTFDDDMISHAKKKMHSTMGEALNIAQEMKARKTLLTHFSQRYVKSDSIKEDERFKGGNVLMAYDHMNVKLGDFKKAAAFQPVIAKLLAQED